MIYFRKFILVCVLILTNYSCSSTSTNSEPNIIEFQDVNFENLVREILNNPSEKIMITDVQSISDLRGYGRNITNIDGLEYFTGLKTMFLSGNNITDISPIANLTHLQDLAFTDNNIVDISPLAKLTNLQYLGLQLNNIVDISPIANLINLKLLKIGANFITDISPLVQNQGIGPEDIMNLMGNPLSETSRTVYIPQLIARGVWVLFDSVSDFPSCVEDKIDEILSEEVRNPPAQISTSFSAQGGGKNTISTYFHRLYRQTKNPSFRGICRQ